MPVNQSLVQSTNFGWTAGFQNMLRKENDRWWSRKPLATQLAIWGIIINGLVATALFIVPYVTDEGLKQQIAHELYHHGIVTGDLTYTPVTISNIGQSMFFLLASMAMYIGAVILAHDSILKERETGTAAWLLSKPLSRKAFVLAKVLANCFGMMVIVLLTQGAIAYVLCSIALGHPVAAMPFLAGIGMMGVNVLFYLVLAMALGAFSLSRGVTLGVPIVIGLIGGILPTLVPTAARFMPWSLGGSSQAVVTGVPLSSIDTMPIIATAVWILLFILAAFWRFERIEL
jgi:ABC-2 type transport system permease protein